jgi:hypothetical protein
MRYFNGALMISLFVGLLCFPAVLRASDAYFVGFDSRGQGNVVWNDVILFYNTGTLPASIRFLGVTDDGAPSASRTPIVLPPRKTVSLDSLTDGTWRARQLPPVPIWVLHLDVPDGVIVESRNQYREEPMTSFEPVLSTPRGKVPMPIIRQLTPAGAPQVHIGTDLGGWDSRINVIVYNGGTEPATATVEVRRSCTDAVVDSRIVTVLPNSVMQVSGLRAATPSLGSSEDCLNGATPPWARNTIVTMTQPGFSIVSNVNENISLPFSPPGTVPIVGLGVEHNERF